MRWPDACASATANICSTVPVPAARLIASTSSKEGEEEIDQLGVELGATSLLHQRARLVRLEGLPVDAVGGERVEDVRDRADPARDRDLVAAGAARVPRAVEFS